MRLKKKGQKAQTYFMVSPLKNALEFFESSYGTTPKRSDRRAPNKFFDNTVLRPAMEQELHTQRSWPIEKCSSLAAHDETSLPLLIHHQKDLPAAPQHQVAFGPPPW